MPPELLIALINFSLTIYDKVAARLTQQTGKTPTREEVTAFLFANADKVVGTSDTWLAANPKVP